jgi:predicted lipid-binding transport protein (Tim44 family)
MSLMSSLGFILPYAILLLGDVVVTLVALSMVGFFIWLIVRYFMRQAKKEIVKNHLQKLGRNDSFWDERKMKQTVQMVHSNAHIAWARRSSYYVTGMASEDLIKEWESIWTNLQQRGLAFHSTRPEIDSITIVGAEDSSDNNKDNFTAEISAYVIRYVYERATRQPIDGHYNGKNLVHDHFTFTRKNDKWVLTEVKFYTGLSDSLMIKSEQEKPGRPEDV